MDVKLKSYLQGLVVVWRPFVEIVISNPCCTSNSEHSTLALRLGLLTGIDSAALI